MVQTFDRGDGLLVTYSDYAALEAERDEWKRRCEQMKKRIVEVAELACYCTDGAYGPCEHCQDACVLIAIAEGRDNG